MNLLALFKRKAQEPHTIQELHRISVSTIYEALLGGEIASDETNIHSYQIESYWNFEISVLRPTVKYSLRVTLAQNGVFRWNNQDCYYYREEDPGRWIQTEGLGCVFGSILQRGTYLQRLIANRLYERASQEEFTSHWAFPQVNTPFKVKERDRFQEIEKIMKGTVFDVDYKEMIEFLTWKEQQGTITEKEKAKLDALRRLIEDR